MKKMLLSLMLVLVLVSFVSSYEFEIIDLSTGQGKTELNCTWEDNFASQPVTEVGFAGMDSIDIIFQGWYI